MPPVSPLIHSPARHRVRYVRTAGDDSSMTAILDAIYPRPTTSDTPSDFRFPPYHYPRHPLPDQTLSRCLGVVVALLVAASPAVAAAYVDPTTGHVAPGRVLRPYEPPAHKYGPGHRGVDLALEVGDDVLAADDGTVAFAGMVAGKPVVSIDHADGIRTTYEPVHAAVQQGDRVREGQFIGTLGRSVDGYPGLNWGARTAKDSYIDPLSLLGEPVIRLKPL